MRPRWETRTGLIVLSQTVYAGDSEPARAGPKLHVGRICDRKDRPGFGEIDHSSFDELLRKHVNEQGLVAYRAWKANPADFQAFDDYLIRLGGVDQGKTASNAAELAFWISTYNAVTITGILREYPTPSIRNHTAKLFG